MSGSSIGSVQGLIFCALAMGIGSVEMNPMSQKLQQSSYRFFFCLLLGFLQACADCNLYIILQRLFEVA
jgi:hypothetical protein